MARKVKIVSTVTALDSSGKIVDALPVREVAGAVVDAAGKYVDPIEVEVDATNGAPVRYVSGLVTTDSAGNVVPVVPIRGGDLFSLFANGENGFLFDPMSDLTRLFTTSTGPTQVAANDDPVGLMLDRSKWAGKTLAQVIAAQPDLTINGDFASAANWTLQAGWTIAGGKATRAAQASGTSIISNSPITVPGKTYRIEYTVSDYAAGTVQAAISAIGGTSRSANGTYVDYIQSNSSGGVSFFGNAAFVGSIDNVSMREIPGNHAVRAGSDPLRPLWKANSNKPFIIPTAGDSAMISPFVPTAALTMAVAVRFPSAAANHIVMGGGVSVGDKRAFIGKNITTGTVAAGWGNESLGAYIVGPDLGETDHVIVVTGDASAREIWLDGTLIHTRVPTLGPDGTGGGIALGYYNNGGSPSTQTQSRVYASLAMNRRATAAEVAFITSQFQQRF